MASFVNTIVDMQIDSSANNTNPAAVIPKSMVLFVDNQKTNLKQIANNFFTRHFEVRTRDREKKLNVVQLMSEYDGNFSTPVCYLRFYLNRAAKFIRYAEELGRVGGLLYVSNDCFIQRYSDLIGSIQNHETACDRRLFRRSIERMQHELAHVPLNLHLQQLLVSCGDDPSQKFMYNTITLGAPAVHHSHFTHGGLERIKTNEHELNKHLSYLHDKLQDILIFNSDIEDELEYLSQIMANPSTNIDHSILKLSLQRVIRAVDSLLQYASKDLDTTDSSTTEIVVHPLIPTISTEEVLASKDKIHEKAKIFLEETKESLNNDKQIFGVAQLNNLQSIANELESHTCKHIMRHIFQESMEIERYSQSYRERFDIAFSQTVIILNIHIYIFYLFNLENYLLF
ncbi:unnamed protein product [Rotaria socialis]|uniref:Uncharacterized protein n=1 Tax=Rotaria socialis TaxID=392032 RepID=A0A817RQJ8_9BILA|nr:unnamed protein product [Rotaria socialis]